MKHVQPFLFALLFLLALPASAQTTVFINEIHYDNSGSDTGEAIEIAGPAGTDLTGWSLVLYNGANGETYNTVALTATIDDEGSGFGAISEAISGIQNGAPDGIVLYDGTNVVQFLSYEGSFMATNDVASGMTSTDIGVSESSSTVAGTSLQLDGVGSEYEDFAWSAGSTDSFGGINAGQTFTGGSGPSLVINEVDADQTSTDDAEFIELYDGGVGSTDLTGFVIVLYNGSDDLSYDAFDLDGFSTDADGYFVLCNDAANVTNCDFDAGVSSNMIQNGADAVALYEADATDFPNDTPITLTDLVDAVVYDTDDADDAALLALLNASEPQVNENENGAKDTESIQRIPNGSGGARNTSTYIALAPTPGTENMAPLMIDVVINEVDADQTSTDDAEFIELYDGGAGLTDLSGLVLVLMNGSDDASYDSFDLDGFSTDADGYFVLCNDAGNVANCDFDAGIADNMIQNGADAVALYVGDAADFPNDTPVTTANLVDALVYDTNDGDDAGLLVLLNTSEPQINEDADGAKDTESMQRIPNGDGGVRNTSSYETHPPTPGAVNEPPPPMIDIVINEVDADQSSTDTAEFVELFDGGTGSSDLTGLVLVLFNGSDDASYEAFDLDGFSTGADGYFVLCNDAANVANCDFDAGVADNMIQNGADAVALYVGDAADFPNDTPVTTANLADAIVYDTNDSDDAGLLVLLNASEPQVNEDADGTKDTESMQRIPNGDGGSRNTSTYSMFTPTPGTENGVFPSAGLQAIHAIQGSGLASPFVNMLVETEGNVVTALAPNGFYMQSPDVAADADPATSEGIFVFTSSAPTVAVGDLVDVDGKVEEFFDFTEITDSPVVTVVGTDAVPAAVTFDGTTPTSSAGFDLEFERFEGMLIEVTDGYVVGPSQSFGTDPEAEAFIVASGMQTFRETGIEFPGIAGLPIWDGNPEIFELDPDKLGLTNELLGVGSTFSATGVLGYEFGGYELFPTSLTVTHATQPVAVRDAEENERTIGALNLFRLFDDIDDGGELVVDAAEYARRLTKFSQYIRTVLKSPHILGVQEVESLKVLQDLADEINGDDASILYTPYLVEGNDVGGIDVGYLVQESKVQVDAVTQLAAAEILTFDGSLLHDRPPLLLEGQLLAYGIPTKPIEVLNLHMRSLSGIDDASSGPRVRQKRLEQAQSVATIVQDRQTTNPNVNLVVFGDLNAFEFTDGYVDVVGQIRGEVIPGDNLLSGPDLVDPNLTNQVTLMPAEERYSFVRRGTAQVLDHALTSTSLDPSVTGYAYGRGNAGAPLVLLDDDSTPLRSSDHDGLVLYVSVQEVFPGTAVLAAENSIILKQGSIVQTGDVLVQTDAAGATLGGTAEFVLEKGSRTPPGFEVKADAVVVEKKARLRGNVFFNSLVNNGTVTGSQTSPLALPVFDFPPQSGVAAGATDVTVPQNDMMTLAGGAYGHVVVMHHASLMLSDASYDFASLTLEHGATLNTLQPVEIRVAEKVMMKQMSRALPGKNLGLTASDIVMYAYGINGVSGGLTETPAAVDIGKFANVDMNIFAPNGSIRFVGKSTAKGAFLAKDIEVGARSLLTLDSYWEATAFAPITAIAGGDLAAQTIEEALPAEYDLGSNYPNPFNPQTTIPFAMPADGQVTLVVYDVLGREVQTLVDGAIDAGRHNVVFNAQGLPSGLYLIRLEVKGAYEATKRMMLVK